MHRLDGVSDCGSLEDDENGASETRPTSRCRLTIGALRRHPRNLEEGVSVEEKLRIRDAKASFANGYYVLSLEWSRRALGKV